MTTLTAAEAIAKTLVAYGVGHVFAMKDPLPVYPVVEAHGVRLFLEDGRQLVDGKASDIARITAPQIANVAPPASNAVVTEAAIGTVVAVAIKKTRRTSRVLPERALADHVNWIQGSHNIRNSSADSATPPTVVSM